MIRACVIGWPISHSRSPMIHGYWLKRYMIEGSYTRCPVEPIALRTFFSDLEKAGFVGCNVTLPHKEAVYRLVIPADETTERLGAVNTVYRKDGKIYGTNTDGEGFIGSLRQSAPSLKLARSCALVLGAGGASLAVVNALLEQDVAEVAVANRTLDRSQDLRARFGKRVVPVPWGEAAARLPDCALLVNTTSLGMTGQPELELDISGLNPRAIVADIVYTPLRTELLRRATAQGNQTVEGLGMLLHQAVRGFSLWFGVTPEVTDDLYDLVARDIDPDYSQ